jgi:Reactive mitochondrial oxygen species modulator 1
MVRLVLPKEPSISKTDHGAGTVTIFQYGAGQLGVMRTLGKYMVASGGMFGYVCVIPFDAGLD